MRNILRALVVSLVLSSTALAQSAFIYKGKLAIDGQPANGIFDIRCRLYGSLAGGDQIGAGLCLNNVTVAAGRFTTVLDFGPQFNTRATRFLEIEVRRDTGADCSNLAGFLIIGPRHSLAPVPLAQYAKAAFSIDAPDGAPLDAVFVSDTGIVGLGTTSPFVTSALHIRQPDPVLVLQDSGPDSTQSGEIEFRNNSGVPTSRIGFTSVSPTFRIINDRTNGHIALLPGSNGNVGIATSAPAAKLDVRGDIRMGSSGQQFAMRASENLRVIRGGVGSFGDRLRGAGFTSADLDIGKYQITFTTPFPSIPAITVTPRRNLFDGPMTASIESVTTTGAVVVIWGMELNRFAYREFDFLVVGPR